MQQRDPNIYRGLLDPRQMRTFQIAVPADTHWRPATCAEVDCKHHREGWKTAIDESTDLGQMQAYHIRNRSGRHYTEDRNLAPGLTVFRFEAGQQCFNAATHKVRVEKPELFIVRDGDWRGNPTGKQRLHRRPEFWVEDFAENQGKLAELAQKG